MAFWTSETLKIRVTDEELIKPCDEARIKHGAYELSLGNEAYITSDEKEKKQHLGNGDQLVIPPGQFGLLITNEEIKIPNDAMGFISIKAGIKFSGLVNVSGFHVDPGFSGKLKFSVYNAGSRNIILSNGQKVFLIWFCGLDGKTSDLYTGDHANQKEISSQDVMRIQGAVHSPAALDKRMTVLEKNFDKRVTDLEGTFSTIKTIVTTLIGGLLIAAIGFVAHHFWDAVPPPPSTSILENQTMKNLDKKDLTNVSPINAQPLSKLESGPESISIKNEGNEIGPTIKNSETTQELKIISGEKVSGNAQETKVP